MAQHYYIGCNKHHAANIELNVLLVLHVEMEFHILSLHIFKRRVRGFNRWKQTNRCSTVCFQCTRRNCIRTFHRTMKNWQHISHSLFLFSFFLAFCLFGQTQRNALQLILEKPKK